MTELEQQEINNRLDAVERLVREKSTVRGPAGDISAALRNTEQAVPILLRKELSRLRFTDGNGHRVEGPAGKNGKDGANGAVGPQGPSPSYETLESIVAHALHDYGILSAEDGDGVGFLLNYAIEKSVADAVAKTLADKS